MVGLPTTSGKQPLPSTPMTRISSFSAALLVMIAVLVWTNLTNNSYYQSWYLENSTTAAVEAAAALAPSNSSMNSAVDERTTIEETTSDGPKMFPPNVVAYAISFIQCGDFQNNSPGLVDASLVLRHSIHKISSRNPQSGSKYDYRMYAIVHEKATGCFQPDYLRSLGFDDVLVVPHPIHRSEIHGETLRKYIHRALCCGEAEFMKLNVYHALPHEVVVHVDIDIAFVKPMDHLFDAIVYDKDSPEGMAARAKLELERPTESLPSVIGAFITRDWVQVAPNKYPPGYQAGFLVARRDPTIMPEALEIVREGNYSNGMSWKSGWHNSGHGGYVGAMAMQGLMAYFYDHVRPGTAVELNQCRHNHIGMDVKYNEGGINWRPRLVPKQFHYGCRNALDYCEDCRVTALEKIYSIHYNSCKKPWMCHTKDNATAWPANSADHCHELQNYWHGLRSDLETKLHALTGDESILEAAKSGFRKDIFFGHCSGEGSDGYVPMGGTDPSRARIRELYE